MHFSLGGAAGAPLMQVKPHRLPPPRLVSMPWTPERYPPAMNHLPAAVRLKAIEIANAVLAEDGDEGKAIRVGIAKAKQWAEHHRSSRHEDIDPFGPEWP
jgi:hypothetical protein